jgi:ubiquinone/menaquinone biosynthesis C-methylase UbiE
MILVNWRMNRWSVALLNIQPAEHVLEVGFGPGLSIRRAAKAAAWVAGIDHSPAMLAEATRRNRAAIQAGRVDRQETSALPFDNDRFDKRSA